MHSSGEKTQNSQTQHGLAEIENKLSKLYLQEGKHHQRPLSRYTLKCEIQCHELISETAEKCRNENVDKKVDLRTGRGKEWRWSELVVRRLWFKAKSSERMLHRCERTSQSNWCRANDCSWQIANTFLKSAIKSSLRRLERLMKSLGDFLCGAGLCSESKWRTFMSMAFYIYLYAYLWERITYLLQTAKTQDIPRQTNE